jgi:tetratricopeptide (TPR) repeat protein
MRILIAVLLTVQLSACGFMSTLTQPRERTLADLEPVRLPEAKTDVPQVSLEELADVYRGVLAVTDDPRTRLQVLHRLADIEMLSGEADLATAESQQAFFDDAIDAYETLLEEHPDNPLNDKLMYQLSKAYDLSGENDKSLAVLEKLSVSNPDSEHVLEAEFRKAESYFSAGKYPEAEQAYGRVVEFGEDTSYYTNSLYMQGWSRFKQAHYRPSISSFTGTLDMLMPLDNNVEALDRGERELVLDCFRVLSVVFSYLEGAETIAAAYEQLGIRPYQHLLYQGLGDLYLKQERYRDSAETYKAYTSRYPESKVAHIFQMRVISSYEAGGFPDLIVEEKQHYVEAFGVQGEYWLTSTDEVQLVIQPKLQLFIDELASYYHALAQDAAEKDGVESDEAVRNYLLAGDYYQLYIDSFPEDPRVPEMGFLLAESRFEAGDYPDAISAYEWVAYQFSDYEKAAEAGYSAILAYERQSRIIDASEQERLLRDRIDSEFRFASQFEQDPRATTVLGHAAGALMELQEYQLAIIASATLTNWQPTPKQDILLPAWLVMGHSHFELQEYPSAEQAYQSALVLMPAGDKRRSETIDRVAASIYKQAEESVALEDYLQAAHQFTRVMEAAPDSSFRVNAQFDAANNFMLAGEFAQANSLLMDFRKRYPKHALTATVAAKLVSNYEEMEDWSLAARELDDIHRAEPDGSRKRQSLYLAAEYYDKAGDEETAILRYRSYANDWPQPLAIRMEAMNRLAELYQATSQEDKRRFWLKKMIAAHAEAGAQQNERSLYLAAWSSSIFANDDYQAFEGIKLGYPIKKSLKKKKKAMERAMAAYTKTNDYGVQQFSTLSTYRMAQIYVQLSADLMSSERPNNIDELALEQYEILLEEQAYPFEEKAIAIHESNTRRSWDGIYDEWVKKSFSSLAELLPARYAKSEATVQVSKDIY